MFNDEPIAAIATPAGSGAIAVVRISGKDCIEIADKVFSGSGKKLINCDSHTLHLGILKDGDRTIDQVLASIFKNPNSYTGEDTVEFSCHGSQFIQHQILQLLIKNGCRTANPGEFTMRAFFNGKLDLSQAEAVGDLISSENEASLQLAISQMRGGFSSNIADLRKELLDFASLIELELDFAEEDVKFADRTEFRNLVERIIGTLKPLIDSFSVGNVIKNGIPVAIVGEPNVGKSTLLNALLNEERAIVSEIAGTTRDSIEDQITIDGIGFRFIDTAGIRETSDKVESIGIQRTFENIEKASVVLLLLDANELANSGFVFKNEIQKIRLEFPNKPMVLVLNKIDLNEDYNLIILEEDLIALNVELQPISAKDKIGIDALKSQILAFVNTGALRNNDAIITNTRHYEALSNALEAMMKVRGGIESQLSPDLMAIDIHDALHHFGLITGQVSNDELLGNIFANFCIGK